MTPFKTHVAKWQNCQECSLCESRNRIVLGKGKIPCDILFIGEAPGKAEDSLGFPFVGPAGQLLDHILERAGISDKRLYFTNLISCIPLDESGQKTEEPDPADIEACRPRLEEIIAIANPKLIVCVGSVAGDYMDRKIRNPVKIPDGCEMERIVHPAFILRSNVATKGLQIQRTAVAIANAVEEMESKHALHP
jgi:DNA polymerase